MNAIYKFADDTTMQNEKLIIDFRKKGGGHVLIYINRSEVERAESIKFLGMMITDNLSWTPHIDMMVKKHNNFFLKWLRKFSMSIRALTNFYRCTIESIISECITAWYSNCSAQE
eukprot:g29107.t1